MPPSHHGLQLIFVDHGNLLQPCVPEFRVLTLWLLQKQQIVVDVGTILQQQCVLVPLNFNFQMMCILLTTPSLVFIGQLPVSLVCIAVEPSYSKSPPLQARCECGVCDLRSRTLLLAVEFCDMGKASYRLSAL